MISYNPGGQPPTLPPVVEHGSCDEDEEPPLAHSSAVLNDFSFSFHESTADTTPPTPLPGPLRKKKNQHYSVASSMEYGGSVPSLPSAKEKTYMYRYDANMDENETRGNWSGSYEFLLSSLGMAVGLGNVWHFPYLCFRNGGGAFLIPYTIMLVFVGVPLFFLEVVLGQFTSSGPMTCWKFAPILKGIGIAQLIVSIMLAIYYNLIMGWSLFYLVASFTKTLPWQNCDNPWNTPDCYRADVTGSVTCREYGQMSFSNGSCMSIDGQFVGVWNYTAYNLHTNNHWVLPSEEYFNHRVLQLTPGITVTGTLRGELVLGLLVAWGMTFFCLFRGIKTSGKVVYFTVLFPYVVLIILFLRGVSLPNAGEGIMFYLKPEWHRLGDAKVWYEAATQIFFSLGLSYGSLIALSSYNRFHNNCLRDALIVTVSNSATSIFAGLVIFSFLGYLAHEFNTTVRDVARSGPGLAFVLYPAAVTQLSVSPIWAVLFFLMLLTLGLDSQFATLEMIVTCLVDQFPPLRALRVKVTLMCCFILFIFGVPLCTESGVYWMWLMSTYCGGWAIMVIGLLECLTLGWMYGSKRIFEDVYIMVGRRPQRWWQFCWQIATPALIVFIIIFSWVEYRGTLYGEDYAFPAWADALGWLMSFSFIIWIPIVAIYKLWREEGTLRERWKYLTLPTEEWGPALVQHRALVDYVDGFIVDPWNKHKSANAKAVMGTWGMNTSDNYGQTNNNIAVIDPWNNYGGARTPSVGSLDNLTANGVNPSMLGSQTSLGRSPGPPVHGPRFGSQMSIGALSNYSYESVV